MEQIRQEGYEEIIKDLRRELDKVRAVNESLHEELRIMRNKNVEYSFTDKDTLLRKEQPEGKYRESLPVQQ